MNLNAILAKFSGSSVETGGVWGKYAAACMGGSFFLRVVYYLGLVNLRDISGFEICFSLIIPLILALAFIAAIKIPRLGHPAVFSVLSVLSAVVYFFGAASGLSGIFSGILQAAAVALFVAACLGYLPRMDFLPVAALVVVVFRVLFVDVFGYLLPITELALFPYVGQCANLFSLTGTMLLFPALDCAQKPAAASETP